MPNQPTESRTHVFDTAVMAKALLHAATWSGGHDEAEPTEGSYRVAKMYCDQFVKQAGADLQAVLEHPQYWGHQDCYGSAEIAIGHDLWLDASSAGVGFWDRHELPADLREKLSQHAKQFAQMADSSYCSDDGSQFYLDALVPKLSVLVTPVGFDDAHFDTHAQREDSLRKAFRDVGEQLHKLGMQKPAPAMLDSATGYVGNQAFYLHRSTDGVRGVISYKNDEVLNFADMPEKDVDTFYDHQLAAKTLLAKAAENAGCELRLLTFGEPGGVVQAPADFKGVNAQGQVVLDQKSAAVQRQRDVDLDGPSM